MASFLSKITGKKGGKITLGNGVDQESVAIPTSYAGIAHTPQVHTRARVTEIDGMLLAEPIHSVPAGGVAGQTEIYATDDSTGARAASITLKPDGSIELLGAEDSLVTFAALKAAMESFTAQLTSEINAHTHVVVGGGPGVAVTSGPPLPSVTATPDLSPAEAKKLKTKG